MNAYEKIRAALEQAYKERHEPCSVELRIDEALAALAELERAAATPRLWLAEPVSGDYAGYENDIVSAAAPEWAIKRAQRCYYAEFRAVPLYTVPPPAPVAEIREPTPEECERICTEYERLLMREGTCGGRDAFDAVRAVMLPKSEGL